MHPCLYHKSHHQIASGKVTLFVLKPYSYKRSVWKYDKAHIGMKNSELHSPNWINKKYDGIDVDETVHINFFMYVISRYIPNYEITCCYRDVPWITEEVKKAMEHKHRVYR